MKLLLYVGLDNPDRTQLEELLFRHTSSVQLESAEALEELVDRLHRPKNGLEMIVLAVSSREELEELVSSRDELLQFRLVIVLPDSERDTLSLAHSLCPRYLARRGESFHNLELVIEQMVTKTSESPALQEKQ